MIYFPVRVSVGVKLGLSALREEYSLRLYWVEYLDLGVKEDHADG